MKFWSLVFIITVFVCVILFFSGLAELVTRHINVAVFSFFSLFFCAVFAWVILPEVNPKEKIRRQEAEEEAKRRRRAAVDYQNNLDRISEEEEAKERGRERAHARMRPPGPPPGW